MVKFVPKHRLVWRYQQKFVLTIQSPLNYGDWNVNIHIFSNVLKQWMFWMQTPNNFYSFPFMHFCIRKGRIYFFGSFIFTSTCLVRSVHDVWTEKIIKRNRKWSQDIISDFKVKVKTLNITIILKCFELTKSENMVEQQRQQDAEPDQRTRIINLLTNMSSKYFF